MLETNNSYILINHKFLKEFTTNSNIKPINLSFLGNLNYSTQKT